MQNINNKLSKQQGIKQQLQLYSEKSHIQQNNRNIQLVREFGFNPYPKSSIEDGDLLPKKYEPFPEHMYGKPLEEIDTFLYEKTFCVVSKRFHKNYVHRFSGTKSLFIFQPWSRSRKLCVYVATNQFFDYVVMATILINCVFLAMTETVEEAEYIFLAIYTCEMLIKIIAKGFFLNKYTYLRNPWNWLDFIVITSGYATIQLDVSNLAGLRTFRVLRALKTVSILPGLKTIINALLHSFKQLAEVMTLTIFCLMVFALFALQVYMGELRNKCVREYPYDWNLTEYSWQEWVNDTANWQYNSDSLPILCGNLTGARQCPMGFVCLCVGDNPNFGYTNFDNFMWSMLTTFQLLTLDYWENVYNMILATSGPYSVCFFSIVVFFGSFYLINLMLAVVALAYEEEAEITNEEKKKEIMDQKNESACKLVESSNKIINIKNPTDNGSKKFILTSYSGQMSRRKSRLIRHEKSTDSGCRDFNLSSTNLTDTNCATSQLNINTMPSRKRRFQQHGNEFQDSNILIPPDTNYKQQLLSICRQGSMNRGEDGIIKESSLDDSGVVGDLDEQETGCDQYIETSIEESSRVPVSISANDITLLDQDKNRKRASFYEFCPEYISQVIVIDRNCDSCEFCCIDYEGWVNFQNCLIKVVKDPLFELGITICIVLNTLFLSLEHHGMSQSLRQSLDIGNKVFTSIFTFECTMKLLALSREFFECGWNIFDLIIVSASLIDIIFELVDGLSVLRGLRLLRVLKLAKSWTTMKVLLSIIISTIGALGNLTLILVIIIYIFAVIGMQLFSRDYTEDKFYPDPIPRWNFNDFFHSFMMIFRILCGEWIEPLWDCMRAEEKDGVSICFAIFLPTLVMGNFMVLNLFLALLLNSFNSEELKSKKEEVAEESKLSKSFDRIRSIVRKRLQTNMQTTKVDIVDEKTSNYLEIDVSVGGGDGDGIGRKESKKKFFFKRQSIKNEETSQMISLRDINISPINKTNEIKSKSLQLPLNIQTSDNNSLIEDKININNSNRQHLKHLLRLPSLHSINTVISDQDILITQPNLRDELLNCERKELFQFLSYDFDDDCDNYLISSNNNNNNINNNNSNNNFIISDEEDDILNNNSTTLNTRQLCLIAASTTSEKLSINSSKSSNMSSSLLVEKNDFITTINNNNNNNHSNLCYDNNVPAEDLQLASNETSEDLLVRNDKLLFQKYRTILSNIELNNNNINNQDNKIGSNVVQHSSSSTSGGVDGINVSSSLENETYSKLRTKRKSLERQTKIDNDHMVLSDNQKMNKRKLFDLIDETNCETNINENLMKQQNKDKTMSICQDQFERKDRKIGFKEIDDKQQVVDTKKQSPYDQPWHYLRTYVDALTVGDIYHTNSLYPEHMSSMSANQKKKRIPDDCFPASFYERCNWMICSDSASFKIITKIRTAVLSIVETSAFEWFVLILIFSSSITLCFEDIHLDANKPLKRILHWTNLMFSIIFIVEMILKWIALGFTTYFTNFWTILDFIIVFVSVFSLLIEENENLRVLRSLRTLRALRPLRAISRWQGMRIVVNALMYAIPSIFNVLLVCLVFWLIFSIIGVQFFGGKFFKCVNETGDLLEVFIVDNRIECLELNYSWINSKITFDHVGMGYLALLQVATFEGWMEIMADAVDARGIDLQPQREANLYAYIYFVIFIVCGSFFTLNLFIGVIIDNFNMLKKKYEGGVLEMFLTESQKHYYTAMKKLGRKKPQKVIKRPGNHLLAMFYDLSNSKRFEIAIFVLIFLNMVAMGIEHYNQANSFAFMLEVSNAFFTTVFGLEAIVKIIGLRHHYFTVPWNMFDFILVFASILGILMEDVMIDLPISPTLLRVVRVFRIGRILRLIKAAKGIRKLLFALVVSLPALFNIGALLALITFIYAILGMSLFGHVRLQGTLDDMVNFQTFGRSMQLLFRLMTSAGWNDVLESLMIQYPDCDPTFNNQTNGDCGHPLLAITYFTSFIIISYLIVINMYIAIILENFNQAHQEEEIGIVEDDLEMFYIRWSKYDPHATQFINFLQLSEFLASLDPPLRIPKPNTMALVSFNLPIAAGNKVHCLDILHALVKHVLGHVEETENFKQIQQQMNIKFKKQFPTRKELEIISSTRIWKREDKAAKRIQKAWRLYVKMKREKASSLLSLENEHTQTSTPSGWHSKLSVLNFLHLQVQKAGGGISSRNSSRKSSVASNTSATSELAGPWLNFPLIIVGGSNQVNGNTLKNLDLSGCDTHFMETTNNKPRRNSLYNYFFHRNVTERLTASPSTNILNLTTSSGGGGDPSVLSQQQLIDENPKMKRDLSKIRRCSSINQPPSSENITRLQTMVNIRPTSAFDRTKSGTKHVNILVTKASPDYPTEPEIRDISRNSLRCVTQVLVHRESEENEVCIEESNTRNNEAIENVSTTESIDNSKAIPKSSVTIIIETPNDNIDIIN